MARANTRNPRTGELDHFAECCDADAVQQLAASLRAAQEDWAGLGAEARGQVLARFAEALEAASDAVIESLLRDTGRHRESVVEVQGTVRLLRRWAEQGPALLQSPPVRPSQTPPIEIRTEAVPYALVGAVTPWNFPLLLSLIDAAPALIAGSACLIKPSEVTPRFVEPLRGVLAQVPELDAVLHFALGDGRVGAAVCESVDMICFTGSVATGEIVSRLAGRRMIPASLELGGKDAALVFADADLDHAARAICWGGFSNAGQACQSIERVYVQREVCDEFLKRLVACTGRLRLNTADAHRGEIGPVISLSQVDIIRAHLADAYDRGAEALIGGEVVQHGGGFWCRPSVLGGVDHGMQIMRDETFAAILPVMPFDDDDEAVALANDTRYGLSGAVFGGDVERLHRIAGRLQAGAISINDCALTTVVHDGEKNSFKSSGLGGSRMGTASIRRFYRTRTRLENPGSTPQPWWY